MKKHIAFFLAMLIILSALAACAATTEDIAGQDQAEAEASGLELHKIGVATYNVTDAQVMMFKDYLDNYIKECFVDVSFLYSDSIACEDDMMHFLQVCADSGCEGIMLFYTNDLQREVEFCADHHMYVIRPSGNVSDAEFTKVADNPWFLGEIGPGAQAEYDAAAQMTRAVTAEHGRYILLSGGASMGNEMHRIRTVAMLETLEALYGAELSDAASLAVTAQPMDIISGELQIVICPGYMELPQYADKAAAAIASGYYDAVLSAIPVTPLMDALNSSDIKCGTIDCFSEDNFFGFQKGKLHYVAGKYESEIGPAFAALLNAITGNADAYRDNGHAFRLYQGFWTAENANEYNAMYALSHGTAVNAYNYEDLHSLVKSLNEDTDFAAFKALTEAWRYDECLTRRAG